MTPEEALVELQAVAEFVGPDTRPSAWDAVATLREALQGTSDQLSVGDVLEDREGGGYCGNAFGDQDYVDRTVVAIGEDWVAARKAGRSAGTVVVVANVDPASLIKYREPR